MTGDRSIDRRTPASASTLCAVGTLAATGPALLRGFVAAALFLGAGLLVVPRIRRTVTERTDLALPSWLLVLVAVRTAPGIDVAPAPVPG